MSNYIEYHDEIAFHPGYYINEIVEESGLTQEDYAKRLGTTPKNLSILIRGEQRLSIDIASKLSRMLGTTVEYWLNLQLTYDEMIARIKSDEELENEKSVLRLIEYKYFRDNYGLPDLSYMVDDQIKLVRSFLKVSSLVVLEDSDLIVDLKEQTEDQPRSLVISTNTMLQIGVNRVLEIEAPKYDRRMFRKAVDYVVSLPANNEKTFIKTRKAFNEAGVVIVSVPELNRINIQGATKRVDGKVMIMLSERKLNTKTFNEEYADVFTNILNGRMGVIR
ncbi:MAG: HigA family addiction module antidote protein [Clostridiales bacterium]|nr:HigA family addiction module antidote protein [Clostridiales bacterium]